jgi:hypothetical protein
VSTRRRVGTDRGTSGWLVPGGTVEERVMERPTSWSDDDLADEIELYGELVVAATAQETPMTPREIDTALGVDGAAEGGAGTSAPAG